MQALPHCSEILSETLGLSFPFMPLWDSQGAKRPERALFPLPLSPLPQINLAPKAETSGETESQRRPPPAATHLGFRGVLQ